MITYTQILISQKIYFYNDFFLLKIEFHEKTTKLAWRKIIDLFVIFIDLFIDCYIKINFWWNFWMFVYTNYIIDYKSIYSKHIKLKSLVYFKRSFQKDKKPYKFQYKIVLEILQFKMILNSAYKQYPFLRSSHLYKVNILCTLKKVFYNT